MRKNKLLLLSVAVGFFTVSACTKHIDLEPLPQNKIIEYKITNINSEPPVYGVIDDGDSTITVYLPFYFDTEVIDPEIKLSEGAKLQNEPDIVDINDMDITYTVIGPDNSTRTYKLILIVQIPALTPTEFSSEMQTASLPLASNVTFSGNFYTKDYSKIRIWLVDKNNKETALGSPRDGVAASVSISGNTYSLLKSLPNTMDTGLYKVKVQAWQTTATLQYPVQVIFPLPAFNTTDLAASRSVKQGDTITVKSLNAFSQPEYFRYPVGSQQIEFPIVSFSRDEMKLKIPNDFPVGTYSGRFYAKFELFPTVVRQTLRLTVSAKE